ncbi:hypothetical protein OG413_42780 [Streptomyces sp. NBC_01433]|uniref:hypothetical protein n=1 Tax=Streptomyces sp. NBC_01433 TaxID=2903864 RepID=UPI0022574EBE|nr:hypothetical protein [Streptomyces sp. NBC_01433]MCX4681926.1 hypothetical protein [Streptomyces sp. NBC_01433]
MSVTTTTHLNFRGTARKALDFYQSVFGGRTVAVTYTDVNAVRNESEADWVMWGEVAGGFQRAAQELVGVLPDASHRTLNGLNHGAVMMAPKKLAPELIGFLRG